MRVEVVDVFTCFLLAWLVARLKFKWRHGNRYACDCGLTISHFILVQLLPCLAHETETSNKSNKNTKPSKQWSSQQTIVHCAVIKSNRMRQWAQSRETRNESWSQVGHWQWQSQGRPRASLQLFDVWEWDFGSFAVAFCPQKMGEYFKFYGIVKW